MPTKKMTITIKIPKEIVSICKKQGLNEKQTISTYKEFIDHCITNDWDDEDEKFKDWYRENVDDLDDEDED